MRSKRGSLHTLWAGLLCGLLASLTRFGPTRECSAICRDLRKSHRTALRADYSARVNARSRSSAGFVAARAVHTQWPCAAHTASLLLYRNTVGWLGIVRYTLKFSAMRGRPNPVEALATLVRLHDETERRANFRQAITALGQSSGASGPPPLDGVAPE